MLLSVDAHIKQTLSLTLTTPPFPEALLASALISPSGLAAEFPEQSSSWEKSSFFPLSWVACFPLSWFTHLFLFFVIWRTSFASFLGRGSWEYTFEASFFSFDCSRILAGWRALFWNDCSSIIRNPCFRISRLAAVTSQWTSCGPHCRSFHILPVLWLCH